jgi:hypothetical protein
MSGDGFTVRVSKLAVEMSVNVKARVSERRWLRRCEQIGVVVAAEMRVKVKVKNEG